MIECIALHARETAAVTGVGEIDERILAVMSELPRRSFVPEDVSGVAEEDRPLPIGHGQTISQPFIVALMTHLARPKAGDRALDVGTGSAYQAAVLSHLVSEVHSIECVEPLYRAASERLMGLGCGNVVCHLGDGRSGLPEKAPFDLIIVAAAADVVPVALEEQLAEGGRLVIPVTTGALGQTLQVIEKRTRGGLERREILPVSFVPLVGAAGTGHSRD